MPPADCLLLQILGPHLRRGEWAMVHGDAIAWGAYYAVLALHGPYVWKLAPATAQWRPAADASLLPHLAPRSVPVLLTCAGPISRTALGRQHLLGRAIGVWSPWRPGRGWVLRARAGR